MKQRPKINLRCAGLAVFVALLVMPATAQTIPPAQDAITQDLAQLPMVTTTKHHSPGDLVNVGLVGSKEEITAVMKAAGWTVPVPVTLKSSVKIAGSVMLRHTYYSAPVSSLFYEGRRQDLAFEKEVGRSASHRHHVRFWKLRDDGPDGRPLWIGAATFDKGVGISHRNGAVTHHINGDVDAERDFLMGELNKTSRLTGVYTVKGAGPVKGKNGGGDVYFSDGNVSLAEINPGAVQQP
jgi:LssY C-terminus